MKDPLSEHLANVLEEDFFMTQNFICFNIVYLPQNRNLPNVVIFDNSEYFCHEWNVSRQKDNQ